MSSSSQRITSIDSLKFIMAIFIVMFHTSALFKFDIFYIPVHGDLGVEFFFLVSGFFLCASYFNYIQNHNNLINRDEQFCYFNSIILSRIKRLYPEYLFCILLSFIRHRSVNFSNFFPTIMQPFLNELIRLKGCNNCQHCNTNTNCLQFL